MSDLKFKRNESFYIRDGWFQKAIHSIHDSQENVFSGTKGVDELGIGSNMVKGLKYWLIASEVLKASSTKSELTPFGELLFKYDPYLETSFSWFLIHYNVFLLKGGFLPLHIRNLLPYLLNQKFHGQVKPPF